MAERTTARREITKLLREIGSEAHTVDPSDGRPISKNEAFARILWKKSLGYRETVIKEQKAGKPKEMEIDRKPEPWAMQELLNRLEGKVQPLPDALEHTRITAEKQVDELSKERLNRIADGEQHE